mmetsp:Transcript_26399/g.55032  ORF Transcript_26399/g.55032 Transcript_26399/m.55032 type:complete len:114 (-) Transcript_26399:131-472(-)
MRSGDWSGEEGGASEDMSSTGAVKSVKSTPRSSPAIFLRDISTVVGAGVVSPSPWSALDISGGRLSLASTKNPFVNTFVRGEKAKEGGERRRRRKGEKEGRSIDQVRCREEKT